METLKVDEAVRKIGKLPTLPSVLHQVLAAAADPDTSALDLGAYITADQSLSAALLRIVNSARYGFYRQITSVTQAIVILGFIEVRNLVLTATAFRVFSQGRSQYDRIQLWRHAIASAMAAERIAKALKLPADEAFVSGLLHDIGKVVLDLLFPDAFSGAVNLAHANGVFIREVEPQIFGQTHADVGAILATHWDLPDSLVAAIRYHHAPMASADYPTEAALSALANYLAHAASLGESSNGCPAAPPEEAIQHLSVNEVFWIPICDELQANINYIDEMLGALT